MSILLYEHALHFYLNEKCCIKIEMWQWHIGGNFSNKDKTEFMLISQAYVYTSCQLHGKYSYCYIAALFYWLYASHYA